MVGRPDLNFRVMTTTCKSHSFFNLLANSFVRLPLYCRKIFGFASDLFFMLLWWCFQLFLLSIIIISIICKLWFFILEDPSYGFWYLVQHVLFFSGSWSKANQWDVALKILWNVPWIPFLYAEAVHNSIVLCENLNVHAVVDWDLQLPLKGADQRWFTTLNDSNCGSSCGSHIVVPMCGSLSSRIWLQTVSTWSSRDGASGPLEIRSPGPGEANF